MIDVWYINLSTSKDHGRSDFCGMCVRRPLSSIYKHIRDTKVQEEQDQLQDTGCGVWYFKQLLGVVRKPYTVH